MKKSYKTWIKQFCFKLHYSALVHSFSYSPELKNESLIIFPEVLELSICLPLHPQNNQQQLASMDLYQMIKKKKNILFHGQLLTAEKRQVPRIFKAFRHKLCKRVPSHAEGSGVFVSSTCSVAGEAPEQSAQRSFRRPIIRNVQDQVGWDFEKSEISGRCPIALSSAKSTQPYPCSPQSGLFCGAKDYPFRHGKGWRTFSCAAETCTQSLISISAVRDYSTLSRNICYFGSSLLISEGLGGWQTE